VTDPQSASFRMDGWRAIQAPANLGDMPVSILSVL
jgi:hypothetical protein